MRGVAGWASMLPGGITRLQGYSSSGPHWDMNAYAVVRPLPRSRLPLCLLRCSRLPLCLLPRSRRPLCLLPRSRRPRCLRAASR